MEISELDGRTEKVGEALAATAKVSGSKVYFKLPGTMGTVTWDMRNNKWYGAPRLIPSIKKAFGIN